MGFLSFVGGNKRFLEAIRDFLGVNRLKISEYGSKYTFSIVAQNDVKRILRLMYEHSTENTRLDRKYNKYQTGGFIE